MKSIIESIKSVNEGQVRWSVFDYMDRNMGNFSAPDANFLCIFTDHNSLHFLTEKELVKMLKGFDMDPEDVTSLSVGESFTEDGMNIYVRIA